MINYVDGTQECSSKMEERKQGGNPITGYPTILFVKDNVKILNIVAQEQQKK